MHGSVPACAAVGTVAAMDSVYRTAWNAARLLGASTSAFEWSAAGRVGNGAHVGKVMNGPHDSDILTLVYSSWDDLELIANLPAMLATEAVRHGVPEDLLAASFVASKATWPTRERIVARLEAATAGVWHAEGTATVTGTLEDLDVTGDFTIVAGADRTVIARVGACSIEDLASVRLIVEGLPMLRQLAASPA